MTIGEGMLGVTIRYDSYFEAEQHLCHVIDVENNSPAELAGLIANADYLLGTAEKAFYDVDVLREELEAHQDRPLELYVYNAEADDVRTCVVLPSYEWGVGGVRGGLLGANVAVGYLHVLPSKSCLTIGKSRFTVANDISTTPDSNPSSSAATPAESSAPSQPSQ
jgi:hypothetical protein